eukprot:gene14804-17784_t
MTARGAVPSSAATARGQLREGDFDELRQRWEHHELLRAAPSGLSTVGSATGRASVHTPAVSSKGRHVSAHGHGRSAAAGTGMRRWA